MGDDQPTTLYVQYPEYWAQAHATGSEIAFDWNNRMYLSTTPTLSTSTYFKPNLLGGSIEFDVNLNRSDCGCLTALYAIVMPATLNNDDPFQYCDGAYVGGHGCPEFDVMEANKYAFRTTAHKCTDNGNSFSACDGNGKCTTDVILEQPSGSYGPGSATGIDTNQEFHVKQVFHESGGSFTGYTTTLSQGSKSVTMSKSDCSDYLANMSTDMTHMVIAISNWSSDNFDWLQHGVCSGSCSQTTTWSELSNLKFYTTTVEPAAAPEPEAVEYAYGDDCSSPTDQDCALVPNCSKCSWSWPKDDPATWASSDAKCRC